MIRVENIDVFNLEGAIRGMRNPLQSHDKSDSCYCEDTKCFDCRMYREDGCHRPQLGRRDRDDNVFIIGKADMELMQKLYKAGTEHRKYLRQIFVSMDIVAPDYFFKEFSTYRIGVTENSTSTMHCIAKKKFELDDFSYEHVDAASFELLCRIVDRLNTARKFYLKKNKIGSPDTKNYWWQMIQLLPMSYNYRRTVTMNYENVVTIIKQRSGHKLDEWRDFIEVLKSLPYIEEIMGELNADQNT